MTGTRLGIVVIAGLAGLLFGFDTAVISGVTQALRTVFGLSPAGLGAAVSSALWGTLVGALAMGIPGDRYGARNCLRLVGVLYVASAIGCALAPDVATFAAFRFVGGIAVGGSSVLAPVYISEIAPAAWRGALVGFFQFDIVLGILVAYLSNYVVGGIVPADAAWRWRLGVAAVPAIVFLALLLLIPQSPRWLAAKGRSVEAELAFRRLGMTVIVAPAAARDELLSWRRHRRPILLAVVLAAFNQLSGINAILYYLGDIFAAAGFGATSSDLQQVAIGATNLAATVAAMLAIDRFGRKTLLLAGSVGMVVALAGVAAIMGLGRHQSLLIWMLAGFIASFAFSQGAVIWVYLSEIFPTPVRARGQGVGSATHWICNAVISGLFPVVAASTRALPFAVFAVCMALQFLIVWRFFPETKGLELERLDAALAGAGEPDTAP
ncbi:MAG TPA: sugar porter family MFS transporter [Stellaceae bacterium]|nr:sugar porter family MFS transporter [Stellaceae bacterium]